MKSKIDGAELQGMVTHWLGTPPNGYLGSSYGSDPQSLLQQPNAAGVGDAFLDKMAKDVPLAGALPAGAINAYFEEIGNDKKRLLIEVSDRLVSVDQVENSV